MNEAEFVEWIRRRWREKEAVTSHLLSKDPVYLAACLMGEAGEAWDVIKKAHRARRLLRVDEVDSLILELGDIYHYLLKLAEFYGIDMDTVREMNRAKLEERDGR